ncbi:aminoglycoside phosphotransferase family protein [Nocardioides sp. GY 10127]|uniref:phosphotransferase family protein n=1 Tax=Nocardioides sp. GY 10127 TaxID=2569762 RepID=UPI0010A8BFDD|nr:aminoglycoside phosphotransferase family protein [Nocardioides sp. GY 10127]TIC81031.1 aminoglycoside phosphotransferase family protein [Nocardioides sp. GY 10127]
MDAPLPEEPLPEEPLLSLPGVGTLRPLPGGFSGRAFLAESAGERTVVRLHPPGEPGDPLVAAAVLRRAEQVVGLVPPVLEARSGDAAAGLPGLLVTGWLEGSPADQVLPTLSEEEAGEVGAALGRLLARLASVPLPAAGRFVDAGLRTEPWPEPWDELAAAVAALAPGLTGWSAQERAGLDALVARAEEVLAEPLAGPEHPVLVHADLNPKNLLLSRTPEGVRPAGVLDWEHAYAGAPETDLGNLLRHEERPALVEPLVEVYADLRGEDPGLLVERARALDLLALVELASRAGTHPPAERAERLLRHCARARDLGATPRS